MKRLLQSFQRAPKAAISASEAEIKDISQLQAISAFAMSLNEIRIGTNHPLESLSASMKAAVAKYNKSGDINEEAGGEVFDAVAALASRSLTSDKLIVEKVVDVENKLTPELQQKAQSWLRIQLLENYVFKLKALQSDGDLREKVTHDRLMRLTDAVLLGTGSERLAEHAKLFGNQLTQYNLQTYFYGILEPEVQSCQQLFAVLLPRLQKHHKKNFPKLTKDYLLDKLELNVKSRCVFCWADPKFSGFQPPPDEHLEHLEALLKSRQTYFKEGAQLGNQFVNDYIGETRKWYQNKAENRATIRNGILFFIATCLVDWYVCIM